MTKLEKLALVLIVMVLILITACLWVLNTRMAAIADDLERFKVETYDRERSLLSVKLPTISDEPENSEPLLADLSEKTESLAKTAAEIVYNIADQDYTPSDIMEEYNEPIIPEEVYATDEADYLLRVLTAEGGSDYVMCGCVAQCMLNAYLRDGYSSQIEMLTDYGYTSPSSWISDAARQAYDDVWLSGVTYTDVEDALYFYASRYCYSAWHETQRFIIEVDGVRFFGRWS